MRLREVRKYKGVFTGKWVKPIAGQTTRGFGKNDSVIVLNADDYKEYTDTTNRMASTGKYRTTDDIKHLREIAQIEFKNRKLNYAWKESVRIFIKKNKHLLEKRYDRFKKESYKLKNRPYQKSY